MGAEDHGSAVFTVCRDSTNTVCSLVSCRRPRVCSLVSSRPVGLHETRFQRFLRGKWTVGDNVVYWKEPKLRSVQMSVATFSVKRLSRRISINGLRGCVSIYEWGGDLGVMYATSCWVIVPLMTYQTKTYETKTFAYEFGASFVKSQCV